MSAAYDTRPDLLEVAKGLAAAHRENNPALRDIYYAADPTGMEVRLVEVSTEVESTGDMFPVRFPPRPDLGLPVPCVIVLLSEEEWSWLERGELELPISWRSRVTDLQRIE